MEKATLEQKMKRGEGVYPEALWEKNAPTESKASAMEHCWHCKFRARGSLALEKSVSRGDCGR